MDPDLMNTILSLDVALGCWVGCFEVVAVADSIKKHPPPCISVKSMKSSCNLFVATMSVHI